MVPRVRAAVKIGKPPLAVIFENDDLKWTKWDFRLVKALEIYEDMKQGTGIPVYWDRSERVRFELGHYVSKSKAILDRAEDKAREGTAKNYGKVFYAIPQTVDDGPLPTLEEYLEEQARKREETAGNIRVKNNVPFSNADWTPPGD